MRVWFESMSGVFHKVHVQDAPSGFILHKFTAPDGGDPHDHPFDIHVTVIEGGYTEERYDPQTGHATIITHERGESFTIPATAIHRIVRLHGDEPCQTLATYGPHVQEVSFWRWRDGQAYRRQHDQQDWIRQ